jgi:hypothetical protein
LDIVKKEHRAALARWLPALLRTDDLLLVAVRAANLNDLVRELQECFRPLIDDPYGSGKPRPDEVAATWEDVLCEAVAFREDLMMDIQRWEKPDMPGRSRITEEGCAALDGRKGTPRQRVSRPVVTLRAVLQRHDGHQIGTAAS